MVNKIANNASVGIIGCGWLGKALATRLLNEKHSVLATSSTLENVEKLNQQSIIAQQLTLPADIVKLAQHDVFTKQSLVISITPQFKKGRSDYADKVKQLVNAAQQNAEVKHIVLLSSTAIYNGLEGLVDEESMPDMTTEKVRILRDAEQAVLNFSKQGCVLRLAGLVGPERHPGKFILANKTLSNLSAPVNLIHQTDAVGIIQSLLLTKHVHGVFNGVSDTHVSKQEYYQYAAKALKLDPPNYEEQRLNEPNRVVSGEKAKKALNYEYVYSDLLAWL